MSRVRRIARKLIPFRVRRAIGITLYRARHQWFRRAEKELPPQPAWNLPEAAKPVVPADDPADVLRFPSFDQPRVSIVVPAHNAWAHTHLCLRAVLESTHGVEYEVLLADDDSSDETTHAHDVLHNVRVVRDGRRRGFVANCNNAAQSARGTDYLLLLNNDTVVQPGWLNELVALADREPDVGIVGAKIVDENGSIQEAGCMIFRDGSAAHYGRGRDRRDPSCNYVKDVDYVSGCCLLIRRHLWDELGGFDEDFSPGYYEDVDLAFRARRVGHRVSYQPRAEVVHAEGVSHGTDPETGVKRFLGVNAEKFAGRWRTTLQREHVESADVYLARDRSKGRTRVLVIDHELPQPDRDAGSRYVDTYMKLLLEYGHHVVFVSDLGEPAEPYCAELQQAGVEVVWGLWTPEQRSEWLRDRARYFDVAYLHRHFVAVKYIAGLRRFSSAKILYSPVDLHFLRERRRFSVTGEEEASRQASTSERDEFDLLRRADVVHVVSRYEEELVRERVPAASVRTLPIYAYDAPYEHVPGFELRRHLLFVAGFMHPPNVDAARWFVNEVFPLVREQAPEVFALLVGSHPSSEVTALAGDGVIVTGRVSERMLENLYRQSRVVICPLRYGAGAKGKLVEALHFGVPSVVTPVAAEGFPDIEECVTVATTATDFADGIIALYHDAALWADRSARASSYAETHFSRAAAVRALGSDFDLSPRQEGDAASESAVAIARRVASR